jgi:uncharacterized protein
MEVYLDSSTFLSVILQQTPRLEEWASWEQAFTSAISRTECQRTIDRVRLERHLSDQTVGLTHSLLGRLLAGVHVTDVTPSVLEQAGRPMATVVRALDAIHLVTAQDLRLAQSPQLVFATHDRRQAIAAVAMGFDVIGV